jgi:hypothetical protein
MSMGKITVRITAEATFLCDPGVPLDPNELAEAIQTITWDFPADDSQLRGIVVAGTYVVLEPYELVPYSVEVLAHRTDLDDAWQAGVSELPDISEIPTWEPPASQKSDSPDRPTH